MTFGICYLGVFFIVSSFRIFQILLNFYSIINSEYYQGQAITVVLYGMVAAYLGEKGLALYKRVMADGKITLDEIEEIIEEVTDLADDAKEMVKDGE